MIKQIGAAVLALAWAGAASATTLYSDTTPTGDTGSPGSFTANFTAGAGTGTADFVARGYDSLDGVNCCTDTFSFIVNGVTLFQGSYDLGGGGANETYIAPPDGSTVTIANGVNGTITGSIAIALLDGANSVTLQYSGADQGLGDEGWGVNSLVVSGNAAPVPEPASWAMMLGGFGMIGGAMRGRRGSERSTAKSNAGRLRI